MENGKTLVVFYSRSGSTKKISQYIAGLKGWDLEEIHDTKNWKGLMVFLFGGRDAIKKNLTTIEKLKKDPGDYDKVIIGTPVWASNLPPATRTFLMEYRDKLKDVAVFTSKGGPGEDAVISGIEEIIKKKPIASMQFVRKEVQTDAFKIKVQDFIKNL